MMRKVYFHFRGHRQKSQILHKSTHISRIHKDIGMFQNDLQEKLEEANKPNFQLLVAPL